VSVPLLQPARKKKPIRVVFKNCPGLIMVPSWLGKIRAFYTLNSPVFFRSEARIIPRYAKKQRAKSEKNTIFSHRN
jgi:hypothetical protein